MTIDFVTSFHPVYSVKLQITFTCTYVVCSRIQVDGLFTCVVVFITIIGVTRIVYGTRSIKRSDVRPSVCSIDRQQHGRPAGLLLSTLQTGGIAAGAVQEMRVASCCEPTKETPRQTWHWVIGSPGQWVIWVIFHVRVTGSSF